MFKKFLKKPKMNTIAAADEMGSNISRIAILDAGAQFGKVSFYLIELFLL